MHSVHSMHNVHRGCTVCAVCSKGEQGALCARMPQVSVHATGGSMCPACHCMEQAVPNLTAPRVYQSRTNKLIIVYRILRKSAFVVTMYLSCHGHIMGQDHADKPKRGPIALPRALYKTHSCVLKSDIYFWFYGAPKMTPSINLDKLSYCRE